MKRDILFTLLIVLIATGSWSQNLEVEGKAKITDMDPATSSAQQVAREPDGTLSLLSVSSPTYAIGDFAFGGVVFWVSPSGAHGKVVSIYDIGTVPYSNITSVSIGPSAISDINGAGNTVAILMQAGHTMSAARHCGDLAYSGYDDWYLPSKNELNAIYTNKAAIDVTALANGGEAFANSAYWSSTEYDSSSAWFHAFNTGFQVFDSKGDSYRVRAVRAF